MDTDYKNMDDCFKSIFGFMPKKRGTGFEMLTGAVLKILNCSQEIKHDIKINGKYSDTPYQIDNYVEDKNNNINIFVEVKDYTERNGSVDQEDILKLLGALSDLEIDEGILTTATKFTKPVKKIAQSTSKNPNAKKITLYTIRPSIDKDLNGRILQINLVLNIILMDEENAKYHFNPNKESLNDFNKKIKSKNIADGQYKLGISEFYNQHGEKILNVSDIFNTERIAPMSNYISSGTWIPEEPVYIKALDEYILIDSIDYKIPFRVEKKEFHIKGDKPKLYVKTEDGTIDRIITEKQLKNISFKEDGTIEYNGVY